MRVKNTNSKDSNQLEVWPGFKLETTENKTSQWWGGTWTSDQLHKLSLLKHRVLVHFLDDNLAFSSCFETEELTTQFLFHILFVSEHLGYHKLPLTRSPTYKAPSYVPIYL